MKRQPAVRCCGLSAFCAAVCTNESSSCRSTAVLESRLTCSKLDSAVPSRFQMRSCEIPKRSHRWMTRSCRSLRTMAMSASLGLWRVQVAASFHETCCQVETLRLSLAATGGLPRRSALGAPPSCHLRNVSGRHQLLRPANAVSECLAMDTRLKGVEVLEPQLRLVGYAHVCSLRGICLRLSRHVAFALQRHWRPVIRRWQQRHSRLPPMWRIESDIRWRRGPCIQPKNTVKATVQKV